jgi:AhpD family alkylhydroperoxidase
MNAPPRPPATVPIVEEQQASGRVREIFDDIKRTKQIDFVPNFWKTLASYPPLLEQTWLRLKTAMTPGKLDALTKEMIALAVSATNGCEYCINSHTAAVKKLGLDDEGLGELMAVVATFNATNALADGYRIVPDVVPKVESD